MSTVIAKTRPPTPQEVADWLGVHVQTIYRGIWDGSIPTTRIGRKHFIDPRYVDQLSGEGDAA